jgi:hypothetical protein
MTVTDLATGEAPRRRQRNREAADRLAVRRAIAEVVQVIPDLQSKAVLLHARLKRTPVLSDQTARIVDLMDAVRATSQRFADIVRSLPEGQRHHSRVIDVHRALESLASSFRAYEQ